MYSMHGSGHCLSYEHKATTPPAPVPSNASAVLSKRGCVQLNHLTWIEWILAAGVFFPSLISRTLTVLFLQGIGTSHHYGIPSVTGVESKQELKHDAII